MKPFAAIAAALLLGGAALPHPAHAAAQVVADAASNLAIDAGKGRLIRLDHPAAAVFIADPKVADVQVKSPTLVYVLGKAPGGTTLYAVDAKEQVIANLAVEVGFDADRLSGILKAHAPESDVTVTRANDALVLTGKVASPAQGEEILRLAARFVYVDKESEREDRGVRLINRLTVETSNQVNLRVRVVEVSKQAREVLGFNWDTFGEIGGAAVGLATGRPVFADKVKGLFDRQADVDSVVASYRKGSTDLNLLVDAMSQKGLVTVLAEPNLTAVSGEPASFLAGGEYPIPVPQGNNQITIDFKKYGVSLAFVATVMDRGRISLNVRPEVSQLSDAGAITLNGVRVPALTTRRAETTVDLGSGQSFAVAGLLQRTTSEDVSKLPGLGDLPVLGRLFRSKAFQKNQSELVIIVTPYLVKPVNQPLAMPADLKGSATQPATITAAATPAPDAPAPAAPDKKS